MSMSIWRSPLFSVSQKSCQFWFAEGEDEAKDSRDKEYCEDSGDGKAAYDDGAEASIEFRARSGEKNKRKHSADGCEGRHEDRAHAANDGFANRFVVTA